MHTPQLTYRPIDPIEENYYTIKIFVKTNEFNHPFIPFIGKVIHSKTVSMEQLGKDAMNHFVNIIKEDIKDNKDGVILEDIFIQTTRTFTENISLLK